MAKGLKQAENYSEENIEFVHNSKKKPSYPISKAFRAYLKNHGRQEEIPLTYNEMLYWQESVPLYDNEGNDTLWRSVIYPPHQQDEISLDLFFDPTVRFYPTLIGVSP